MKPIEPGCLALVISGNDTGMVVTCVEYNAPGFYYRAAASGKLMRTLGPSWITDDPDGVQSVRDQSQLMRLDDGEDESVTEHRAGEVSAS